VAPKSHHVVQRMSAGSVDFKTMFMGSCVLVSLLGGSLWTYWNHVRDEQIESIQSSNIEQWRILREMGQVSIQLQAREEAVRRELDGLRKDTNDQETRIRQLEYRGKH
jgi:hypothetical protein